MSSIRVLIVDDFELWRLQICRLLKVKSTLIVIGEAADGLEAVQKANDLKPDLIVLDIGLPKLNGIEAAKRILKLSPYSKIIFLSQNQDPAIAQAALDTGALGYVHKASADAELVNAIDVVLRRGQYVSSCIKSGD
ncbi:MAG: response regulator transcription factor [Terracidiphilus sp.]